MNRIKGLDVKAWHSYIVLPGSIHPDTRQAYQYMPGKELRSLADLPPFDPAWVVEKPREPLRKPRFPTDVSRTGLSNVIHDIHAYLLGIPSEQGHNGNKGLMLVCYVLADRYDFSTALGYLKWWNSIKPKPQWKSEEIERALSSAFRRKFGEAMT